MWGLNRPGELPLLRQKGTVVDTTLLDQLGGDMFEHQFFVIVMDAFKGHVVSCLIRLGRLTSELRQGTAIDQTPPQWRSFQTIFLKV